MEWVVYGYEKQEKECADKKVHHTGGHFKENWGQSMHNLITILLGQIYKIS
ncbi:MAG: hypothetical protein J5632_03170 [Bacteroidales bacterium]|nr:hypothetical protein [Bacteroidales bacterium]